MLAAALSGLVTGLAIAVPVGAVGVLLVSVTARTSWRVGAAAALGIATVDGLYATVAVVGGAAAAALLAPVAEPLRVGSAAVLVGIAGLTAWHAVARADAPPRTPTLGPGRAYGLFLALTAVNPATVAYFAAIVLANRGLVAGPAEAAAFVVAAFAASACWQLTLAGGGAGLGRALTTPRGRLATGLVSATVIAGLAVHTVLSGA